MDSNERSGPLITFPVVSPGTGTTPLSISATSTPRPVAPCFHAWVAWVTWAISSVEPSSAVRS